MASRTSQLAITGRSVLRPGCTQRLISRAAQNAGSWWTWASWPCPVRTTDLAWSPTSPRDHHPATDGLRAGGREMSRGATAASTASSRRSASRRQLRRACLGVVAGHAEILAGERAGDINQHLGETLGADRDPRRSRSTSATTTLRTCCGRASRSRHRATVRYPAEAAAMLRAMKNATIAQAHAQIPSCAAFRAATRATAPATGATMMTCACWYRFRRYPVRGQRVRERLRAGRRRRWC